jgi:hypothetical protein
VRAKALFIYSTPAVVRLFCSYFSDPGLQTRGIVADGGTTVTSRKVRLARVRPPVRDIETAVTNLDVPHW